MIYVIGGFQDGKRLGHMERYCPDQDKWEVLAEMNEARSSHTAISMPDGFIYVFGGQAGNLVSNVERYDIEKNEWNSFNSLMQGKSNFTVVPSTDSSKLYLIGGKTSGNDGSNEIEEFDITTGKS